MITPILKRMTPARPHLAALVGMLVCSLILASVLFYQAYQATRGEHERAREMLSRTAAISAGEWNRKLQRTIVAAMNSSFGRTLSPAMWKRPEFSAQVLAENLMFPAICRCPPEENLRGVFVYDIASGASTFTGSELPDRVRADLEERVKHGVGTRLRDDVLIGVQTISGQHPAGAVFYAAVYDSPGPPRLLLGFHTSPRPLEGFFDLVWEEGPLLATYTDSNASLFGVQVTDRDGAVWFASTPTLLADYARTDSVLPIAPDLRATMAVLPGAESSILIGGMPRSRLPALLLVIAVTTGLLVMAMLLIRREHEITRLRSDFVAGVSHELRTPLAQIKMFTETLILGRVRSDAERQRSLDIIDQEARRLTHLVENVLMFARSERGSARLHPEPVDVASDVRDAIHGFAILSRTRAVEIRPELQEDVILPADRGALRQILLNLLDNAVKYGPLGQRITVGLAMFDGVLRLWVDDEGPGIPVEERSRVFESFYRMERHAALPVAGSGIGLAIVRELVQLHEGSVWFEEAPGGGARVVVEFPRAYLRTEAKPGEWAVA